VLAPIEWVSFRRNEVKDRASPNVTTFFADTEERRTQRNTVALRDVDYVITASFAMTDKAGPSDNVTKFEEIFERRLSKGQHFQQPYLGCREFAAEVEPAPDEVRPIQTSGDRPLGLMLYDFAYSPEEPGARPLFFEAHLRGGVLSVPPFRDVLRDNRRDLGEQR
jgi:CRISPR-associated protein Cas5d